MSKKIIHRKNGKLKFKVRKTPWPLNCMDWRPDLSLSKSKTGIITLSGTGKIPDPLQDAYWHKGLSNMHLLQINKITYHDDVYWKAEVSLRAGANLRAIDRLILKK